MTNEEKMSDTPTSTPSTTHDPLTSPPEPILASEATKPKKRGRPKGSVTKSGKKMGRPRGDTIQIRFLVKQSNLPYAKVRALLHSAGVKSVKGSDALRPLDSVSVSEATAALSGAITTSPSPTSPSGIEKLSADAKIADKTLIPPLPVAAGTGSEDDPVPESVISGQSILSARTGAFPMPRIPSVIKNRGIWADSEYVYKPINTNDARLKAMYDLGWRRVTRPETLWRLYPDGSWKHHHQALGVVFRDLVLCRLPIKAWLAKKAETATINEQRIGSAHENYRINLEAAQRELRKTMGPDGAKAIGYVEVDAEEAAERSAFDKAKARGEDPTTARTFLGR